MCSKLYLGLPWLLWWGPAPSTCRRSGGDCWVSPLRDPRLRMSRQGGSPLPGSLTMKLIISVKTGQGQDQVELCKPLHCIWDIFLYVPTPYLNKFNVSGKICELCFLVPDPDDPDMMKTYDCEHRNITVNCEHNIQKDGCADTWWRMAWGINFCRILCNNKWRVRESFTYISTWYYMTYIDIDILYLLSYLRQFSFPAQYPMFQWR